MSRRPFRQPINRRTLLKGMGAASIAATVPTVRGAAASLPRSAQAGGKEAVIYMQNAKPYTLWTGIRFWTWSGIPARMLFEPLLDIDDALLPAPGLVEAWEVVNPTLTRYHLRSGLTWSDGLPLTADDVAFSMNLTFHPELGTLTSTEIATIAGGDEVKAGTAPTLRGLRVLDPQTFEIETAVPDASVLRTLALRWWAPLPRHVYENVAPAALEAAPELAQPPVVSGPFKLDRIETDQWYEMSANPSYWRGAPMLDRVTYVFGNIGDPVALASQERFHYFIARQPDVAAALSGQAKYRATEVEYIQPYRRQFNAALPKYADPRVRKAVAYAIDRETLSQQIYRGSATPQYTDFLGDLLAPDAEVYRYDPDLARKLLAEANWDASQVMHFDAVAPAAGEAVDPIAQAEFAAYQQWLGEVGVTVEQRLHPDTATYSDVTRPGLAEPPAFETYENPHRRYDVYGPLELKTYVASQPANYAYWSNAEADRLVRQALAETDPQRYAALARQLSIIVAAECPYIPTKAVTWSIVAHETFSGYAPIGEAYFAHARPYEWDVTE